jgi:hypothetical protein
MNHTVVVGGGLLPQGPRSGSPAEVGHHVGLPNRSSDRTQVARRCDDLALRLRELVAEADLLGREVEHSTDDDLVLRLIETSYAVRRALLALDPSGGSSERSTEPLGRS